MQGIQCISKDYINLHETFVKGAFRNVFSGEWASTQVAMKQVCIDRMNVVKYIISEELMILAHAQHQNIVQFMAYAIEEDDLYIITEFINGNNLQDRLFKKKIRSKHYLRIKNKNLISLQCCMAIAYLHHIDPMIIHQDIKPANVLIYEAHFVVKLCDMGVARLQPQHGISVTQKSGSLSIAGTTLYQAPECIL